MSDDKTPRIGDINVSMGDSNRVGDIGHKFYAPPDRDLDSSWGEPLKAKLLSGLPRDKEITVMALLGDAESCRLGAQIHAFLKTNGFRLKEEAGIIQGAFTPPPKGLQFNSDTNMFVVGSR